MNNIINLFGRYFNTDHFRTIVPSSRLGEFGLLEGKHLPCIYLSPPQGETICATEFVVYDDEKQAEYRAANVLSKLLDP